MASTNKPKTVKPITETNFKKKLSTLTTEQKDTLLLSLYKSNKEQLSFYFGDKDYRDAVLASYKLKLTKVFNPSERKLLTSGVDVSKAKALIKEYENIALSGNVILSSYYKAGLYLHVATEAVEFLSTYGGGPDDLYDLAFDTFSLVCSFIEDYIGKEASEASEASESGDVGPGTGLEGSEDLAWDFWIDHSDDLKHCISLAGSVGEGLSDSMQSKYESVEKRVNEVYKEV